MKEVKEGKVCIFNETISLGDDYKSTVEKLKNNIFSESEKRDFSYITTKDLIAFGVPGNIVLKFSGGKLIKIKLVPDPLRLYQDEPDTFMSSVKFGEMCDKYTENNYGKPKHYDKFSLSKVYEFEGCVFKCGINMNTDLFEIEIVPVN